ncbi:MBL fold metallo-hydrolase [Nocardioides sp.]|uniref:MBL fold metallo-hydrolase n=1 Tax=Nocardioides sp. TaxID=35761 RepID=UPI0035279BCB
MRVTWVGHATVVLDLAGVRVLTDPLLRRHAGPLRRVGPAPDPAAWTGSDLVLVSHLHSDHASVASLRMLPGVPMLSAARNERWLASRVGARVVGAADDDWVRMTPEGLAAPTHEAGDPDDGVTVRLVRADHHSRPMPHRPNEAHGHLLRSPEGSVWFAGDTSLYDDMSELPELAGGTVDLALLPIGGWGPRLSAGHMGPEEAVEACRRVRPRAVLPIHYGTFHARGMELGNLDWMTRPGRLFRRRLAAACPGVRLLDLPLGGSVEL